MKNTRVILSLSFPAGTAKEIRRTVREEGYASVSEYFRTLLRDHMKEKLARELDVEKKMGGWKRLKSLRELR